jgi:hypothetical protein
MKVITVILSFLTILLSTYPCCEDKGSCSDVSTIDYCGSESSQEVPHGKDGPCSPFYNCGRCLGFTITYKTLALDSLEIEIETLPIPYIDILPKEVYFYSLKPPRIIEV